VDLRRLEESLLNRSAMLLALSIRDVVLIDRLDLTFDRGLCALTGETGGGKSILLDALGLALGMRADAGLLRSGARQAVVAAEFDGAGVASLPPILEEHGIAAEPPLMLRRVLGEDGRSRAFVNDQPVSVGLLRRIGDTLVEVQGQFEQHGLLNPATHREILDAFGTLREPARAVVAAWQAWRAAISERDTAAAAFAAARREEEFLRHALGELEALAAEVGEEAALNERRGMLMHAEKLLEGLNSAYAQLAGDGGGDGADARLHAAIRQLDRMADRAGELFAPAVTALERASAELGEALAALQAVGEQLDLDPHEVERVSARLFAIRELARKHGVEPDALPELQETMARQIEDLDAQGDRTRDLEARVEEARVAYLEAARTLGAERRRAAQDLDAKVNAELPPLRLERARFRTIVDVLDEDGWGPHGLDRIRFEIATNPGQAPGPLHKIASGGELARVLLALKVALAAADPVPTIVFDEVDSGIGGATAAAVGDRLARLAEHVQVLVVTHSPQVAARAEHHFQVRKTEHDGGAVTRVDVLDPAERREEIARMLSGARITDEARAAADRLMGIAR
jgi:DNA repair protein RecN (Recombination protein N)